jgi:CubicO group peptidase (beta-lactamase class C family)
MVRKGQISRVLMIIFWGRFMQRASQAFFLWLFLTCGAATAVPSASTPPLDGYVEEVMNQWAVPGLAIAVVKDGAVVFAKGYGVRDSGRPEPVDENTIFEIGSMTKSFTTAAAAILVDEGKLQWDGLITSYLPGFQFPDPWITSHAILKDIAAHRTGIDANIVWGRSSTDLDSVLQSVRYLTPVSHFGEYFYSNTGMMTLGKIVEKVSGQRWEDFYESHLFAPLGMTRSSVKRETYIPRANLAPCWLCTAPERAKIGLDALDKRETNVAAPHGLSVQGNLPPGKGRKVDVWPWRNDRAGPAGAVNSTAHDLAQWLIMQIDQGEYRGKRLFSRTQAQQMHSPHVSTYEATEAPRSSDETSNGQSLVQLGYGYGWRVEIYRGHRMISHGGGEVGFGTHMLFFPEERLGIVVLGNVDYRDSDGHIAIARRFADYYLGLSPLDWNAFEARQWTPKHEARELDPKEELERHRIKINKEDAERYPGDYDNPAIGAVTILSEQEALVLKIEPLLKADIYLRDLQHGSVVFRGADRWQMSIAFTLGDDGKVSGFVLGKDGGELLPFVFGRLSGPHGLQILNP